MSQEKVNKYKEQKANRKEIIKKEKREAAVRKTIAAIVAVACIGWIGFSVYGRVTDMANKGNEVNLDAYTEYLSEMSSQE